MIYFSCSSLSFWKAKNCIFWKVHFAGGTMANLYSLFFWWSFFGDLAAVLFFSSSCWMYFCLLGSFYCEESIFLLSLLHWFTFWLVLSLLGCIFFFFEREKFRSVLQMILKQIYRLLEISLLILCNLFVQNMSNS